MNRPGKRIGLLCDHAEPAPEADRARALRGHRDSVDQHVALRTSERVRVDHAVQPAQKGELSRFRGTEYYR